MISNVKNVEAYKTIIAFVYQNKSNYIEIYFLALY